VVAVSSADVSRAFVTSTCERRVLRRGPGRLLPHTLGSYTLFDHIGRGGMADIYRARTTTSLGAEREVVIKEVLPELCDIPRFAELLAAEAKLASGLTHANVVTIEHLGRDDGKLYIAMEYIEGLDLRQLLRRCARQNVPLPVDFALRIVMEVLKGLSYAHRFRFADTVGIVHRDVSPSNVLLSFEGELKLCDFGIARANDAAVGVSDDAIEGKAGYMSPEQAMGERVDARSDIYAVGILLWELCAGRRLYKAAPGESLLDVAARADVPPLAARGLPSETVLFTLVRKALSRSPERRFRTADEMLRELEDYAVNAKLMVSSLRFGRWLSDHFEPQISSARRAREKAVRALALGPVAVLRPIEQAVEPTPTESADTHTGIRKRRATRRPKRSTIEKRPKKARKRNVTKRTDIDRASDAGDSPPSLAATTTDIEELRKAARPGSPRLFYVALLAIVAIAVAAYLLR